MLYVSKMYSLLLLRSASLYGYTIIYHLFVDGYLGCFQLLLQINLRCTFVVKSLYEHMLSFILENI